MGMGCLLRAVLGVGVVLILSLVARGDLVSMLGVRAVQLSDRIVEATLEKVTSPVPLADDLSYQILHFKVVRAIDEPAGSGAEVQVVRMLSSKGVPQESDGLWTESRQGEQFLLQLRRMDRVESPVQLRDVKALSGAYVIVLARPMKELTENDLTDLRQITQDVRRMDKDTRDEEIRDLAGALLVATDPIEIAEVEDRLLAIGPRCVPFLKRAVADNNSSNRARLQSIIDEIDVPRWTPSPLPR